MLTPYRRHLKGCPDRKKGQHFTLCQCPIWIYGELPNGEPVRQSLRTEDWPRALQIIDHIARGGGSLIIQTPGAPTVERATAAFLKSCESRNLRKSTRESYRRTLERLNEILGPRQVESITVPDLDIFMTTRKIKPRTKRKEIETLRAFFAWCVDRDWIQKNPAKKIKAPLVDDIATLPFTQEEVGKLLKAAEEISSDDPAETPYIRKRARALVYALLYSGLRISDVTLLKRWQLDPDSRHLTLRQMKTGVPLKVLLHADAVAALRNLPAVSAEYFFWTGHGDAITCTKNLRRTIQRVGTLAKVAARPHRFRDTFAVELLTNGADIRTVQMLLGHTSVKTTERHYTHFVAAHQALLDSAAATLDFGKQPGGPFLVKPLKDGSRDA